MDWRRNMQISRQQIKIWSHPLCPQYAYMHKIRVMGVHSPIRNGTHVWKCIRRRAAAHQDHFFRIMKSQSLVSSSPSSICVPLSWARFGVVLATHSFDQSTSSIKWTDEGGFRSHCTGAHKKSRGLEESWDADKTRLPHVHLSGTNCLYLVIQSLELILRQGKAMNGASFLPRCCTKGGELSYCRRLLISLVFYKFTQVHTNQEWTPRPAGNPPGGESGVSPPRPALWGGRGTVH